LQHHKNERHEKKVLLLDRHSPDSREKLILGINKILTAEITTHHDGNKLMFRNRPYPDFRVNTLRSWRLNDKEDVSK